MENIPLKAKFVKNPFMVVFDMWCARYWII